MTSNPALPALAEGVDELVRLVDAGSADEAHALALTLLAQLESAPVTTVASAHAANILGGYFSVQRFDAQARRALLRAFDGLRDSGVRDDALLAGIHNNLGQLDERAGDLAAAQTHLEQALALERTSTASPVLLAYTADNLGGVLARRGKLDRAEALHREALAALDQAGPKYRDDVAVVLGNLGTLYRQRRDVSRARAYLLRALDMSLKSSTLEAGKPLAPLVNLAGLALEAGDGQSADELADMLLRVGGDDIGARHQPIAVALLSLAKVAFNGFRLQLAERLATRALALLEVTAGRAADSTLKAVQLLANVHNAMGNHEAAEQGLMRALNSAGLEPRRLAELMIDFGKAVRSHGKDSAPTAAAMFERAIAQLRPPGSPPARRDLPLLASALGNLAELHFDLDDSARADAMYAEALALGPPRSLGADYPWLIYGRALLQYHLAKHDEALLGMQRALRLWSRQRGRSHPFVATVHDNLALIHWARGDHAAAQRSIDRAMRLQAPEVQRTLLVGSERQRLQAAHATLGSLFKQISLCFDAGQRGMFARGAAQVLLQRKGAVLDALGLTHVHLRERLDDAARERFDRLAEIRRRLAETAFGASVFGARGDAHEAAGWQAEEERLEAELSHAGALGLPLLQPITLQAVRAALPAGAVLVELVRRAVFDPLRTGRGSPWRDWRYAAMVLRPRGDPRWFDLGDAVAIEAATGTLRGLLGDPESDTDAVWAAAAEVHRRLIEPLEPLLAGGRTLYIAPDGELNLLPFGVLAPVGQPMLCERLIVNHLASGRDLLRAGQVCRPEAEVHAFVDADFNAGAPMVGGPRLPALSGTRKEAAALQTHFAHCKVHAGIEASVEALKALRRPALLHIATHGFFAPAPAKPRPVWGLDMLRMGSELVFFRSATPAAVDNPMLGAGLALSGANASVPGKPVGFISAAELAGLDLRGTELVVLSACETGLGAAAKGDEFAGLRRAFAIAGADSQVISLWAIDDDAAAALMAEYYRLLAQGHGRAEALATAQRALRARPRFAHPNAWAAFVAWGRAGPLSKVLRDAATGIAP